MYLKNVLIIGPICYNGSNLPWLVIKKPSAVITVKRLIIGDNLFGGIGEFKKITKINRHQNKNIAILKYCKVKNCQINYSPNCHI